SFEVGGIGFQFCLLCVSPISACTEGVLAEVEAFAEISIFKSSADWVFSGVIVCQELGADVGLCEDRLDDLKGLRSLGLDLDEDESLCEDRLEDLEGMRKHKFGLDPDEDEGLCEGRRGDPKGPYKTDFDLDLGEDEGPCFLCAGELLEAGAASRVALAAASILPGVPLESPQAFAV
ncbi:unnamed protein product, partial [Prorocentrum cordatum]